jgi:hypothetical protein
MTAAQKTNVVKLSASTNEDEDTMLSFCAATVRKVFVTNIPMDSLQELPAFYMFLFGTLAYIIAASIFSFFIWASYLNARSRPFLSLQSSAGDCSIETIIVTDTFTASSQGIWSGNSGFKTVDALYNLNLNIFKGTSADFTNAMNVFRQDSLNIGQLGLTQNLASNLIYWIGYIAETEAGGSTVTFEMTGTASAVFDLRYLTALFTTQESNCNLDVATIYDRANSRWTISYNYTDFQSTPNCSKAIDPAQLGYSQAYDRDAFNIAIDVDSLIVAMAVNIGALPVSYLQEIPGSSYFIQYDSLNITFTGNFDPRTPQMTPIYCSRNVTNSNGDPVQLKTICTYKVGSLYGLPIFNHLGANHTSPEYCDCTTAIGLTSLCQSFTFIPGLLFYHNNRHVGLSALVQILQKAGGYVNFNRDAYNASFAGAASIYNDSDPILTNPTWRENAYAFCKVPNATTDEYCSLLILNTWESDRFTVADENYQLQQGSCTDSFSISQEAW